MIYLYFLFTYRKSKRIIYTYILYTTYHFSYFITSIYMLISILSNVSFSVLIYSYFSNVSFSVLVQTYCFSCTLRFFPFLPSRRCRRPSFSTPSFYRCADPPPFSTPRPPARTPCLGDPLGF